MHIAQVRMRSTSEQQEVVQQLDFVAASVPSYQCLVVVACFLACILLFCVLFLLSLMQGRLVFSSLLLIFPILLSRRLVVMPVWHPCSSFGTFS